MYLWLAFGALALAASVASWRDLDLRPVGIAVVASWIVSNAAHWYLSPLERPAAYTVAEAMVLSTAFLAHVCGAGRMTVAIVAVCTVSIGLNLYTTRFDTMTLSQINWWEISTNLCFAAECLLVITLGLYERSRSWLATGRGRAALHGRAPAVPEAE